MIIISETDSVLFRIGREYVSYLDQVVQKSNEALSELSEKYGAYIDKVPQIYYKDKTYRLVNTFPMAQKVKCGICGRRPIKELFIISSNNEKTLKIGPFCIDRFTNMEVSTWISKYREKRKNIIENRKKIEGLSSLLESCVKCDLDCNIHFDEVGKIRIILEQLGKGLKLKWKQETFIKQYLNKKEKLCD